MTEKATAPPLTDADDLLARMRQWLEPSVDDEARCAICAWPLAASTGLGCVRGNCSMRPFPARWYAPDRARREYGPSLSAYSDPPLTFSLAGDDVRAILAGFSEFLAARQRERTIRESFHDDGFIDWTADSGLSMMKKCPVCHGWSDEGHRDIFSRKYRSMVPCPVLALLNPPSAERGDQETK